MMGPTPASAAAPPPYMAAFPGPMMYRPPRNPYQNAAVAGGVLILTAGICALIFGNLILYHDAFFTEWDNQWSFEIGPFVAGVLLLAAFGASLVSTYNCFRHDSFVLALGGPAALVVAHLSISLDDWIIMVVASPILVLSVIALFLVIYSRRIFDVDLSGQAPSPPAVGGGAPPPTLAAPRRIDAQGGDQEVG